VLSLCSAIGFDAKALSYSRNASARENRRLWERRLAGRLLLSKSTAFGPGRQAVNFLGRQIDIGFGRRFPATVALSQEILSNIVHANHAGGESEENNPGEDLFLHLNVSNHANTYRFVTASAPTAKMIAAE
jgi:hypothetical protein